MSDERRDLGFSSRGCEHYRLLDTFQKKYKLKIEGGRRSKSFVRSPVGFWINIWLKEICYIMRMTVNLCLKMKNDMGTSWVCHPQLELADMKNRKNTTCFQIDFPGDIGARIFGFTVGVFDWSWMRFCWFNFRLHSRFCKQRFSEVEPTSIWQKGCCSIKLMCFFSFTNETSSICVIRPQNPKPDLRRIDKRFS